VRGGAVGCWAWAFGGWLRAAFRFLEWLHLTCWLRPGLLAAFALAGWLAEVASWLICFRPDADAAVDGQMG